MRNWQQPLLKTVRWLVTGGRSPLGLLCAMAILSVSLWGSNGWALDRSGAMEQSLSALAALPASALAQPSSQPGLAQSLAPDNTLSDKLQIGREIYFENCAKCHIPVPPEVLPTESWKEILQRHNELFGTSIVGEFGPTLLLMWNYLSVFSRALPEQTIAPVIINRSPYFKALHPRVELPELSTHRNCLACHPGATQLDYRSLTPEWENSP